MARTGMFAIVHHWTKHLIVGQSIAVAHDPPRLTLHSIQDGQLERSLPVIAPYASLRQTFKITGIWWFQEEVKNLKNEKPDIFKRNGIVVRAFLA